MKKKTVFLALAFVLVAALAFNRWRNPPLRTPTAAQIGKALPNGAQQVFDGADKFVLYALEPSELMKNMGHKTYFHGFGILGETTISDAATMQQLSAAYYDGLCFDNEKGLGAACFNPRHGLRAVKNGQTLDLVICFHCAQAEVFFNGREHGVVIINKRPQNTFNRIYNDAGLKMAP